MYIYTDTREYVELKAKQEQTPAGWEYEAHGRTTFYTKAIQPFELSIIRYLDPETEAFIWVLEPNALKGKQNINFVSENIQACVEEADKWIAGDSEYKSWLADKLTKQVIDSQKDINSQKYEDDDRKKRKRKTKAK